MWVERTPLRDQLVKVVPLLLQRRAEGKFCPLELLSVGRAMLLPLEQCILEVGGCYSDIGVLHKRAFCVKLG